MLRLFQSHSAGFSSAAALPSLFRVARFAGFAGSLRLGGSAAEKKSLFNTLVGT